MRTFGMRWDARVSKIHGYPRPLCLVWERLAKFNLLAESADLARAAGHTGWAEYWEQELAASFGK